MSDLSSQLISSIPITHMSRLQWIQFKSAIERVHELEEALQAMREKHADLLAQTEEAVERWEEFASYLIRAEKNRAAYQGEDVLELAAKHAAEILNATSAKEPTPTP